MTSDDPSRENAIRTIDVRYKSLDGELSPAQRSDLRNLHPIALEKLSEIAERCLRLPILNEFVNSAIRQAKQQP